MPTLPQSVPAANQFFDKIPPGRTGQPVQVLLNKEIPINEVTKSAFCLARKKLGHAAFLELDKDQIDGFYRIGNYNC